jgi:hypothetical protein
MGCGGSSPELACPGTCSPADLAVQDTNPQAADLQHANDTASPPDLMPPAPDLAPVGDPLQPATDPADVALKDPNRPSACMGLTALDPSHVVDFFPDGWGYWNLAVPARQTDKDLPMSFYEGIQNCTAVTGCDAGYSFKLSDNFFFYFSYDDTNRLWLKQYNNFTGQLITQRQIDNPVTTASFAVAYGGRTTSYDMRRMAVVLTEQRICLETLWSVTSSDATGYQQQIFSAMFSNDHTTLPPRPSPSPIPSPSPTCSGAAATQAELVAWFAPGSSSVIFLNDTEQGKERECHRLTGCSAWRGPSDRFFNDLEVQGTSILVNGLEPGIGTYRNYLLTNSAFSSTNLDIVVTPTCARASGDVTNPGPHDNQLESVTVSSVNKP